MTQDITFKTVPVTDHDAIKALPRNDGSGLKKGRAPSPLSVAIVEGEMVSIDTSSMSRAKLHSLKQRLRSPNGYVRRRGFHAKTRTRNGTLYVWAEREQPAQ